MKIQDSDVDSVIICRCEEITEVDIIEAVRSGCRTVTEVKKYCRAGMGLCQGRTCGPLIRKIIAREWKCSLAEVPADSSRFPVFPVELSSFVSRDHDEDLHS